MVRQLKARNVQKSLKVQVFFFTCVTIIGIRYYVTIFVINDINIWIDNIDSIYQWYMNIILYACYKNCFQEWSRNPHVYYTKHHKTMIPSPFGKFFSKTQSKWGNECRFWPELGDFSPVLTHRFFILPVCKEAVDTWKMSPWKSLGVWAVQVWAVLKTPVSKTL